MQGKVKYTFEAKMWQNSSNGGWCFVTIPKKFSDEIRIHFKNQEEGWGRMKVEAILDNLSWKTSVWFDTKKAHYLLPIKAEIRKKAKLNFDEIFNINILI